VRNRTSASNAGTGGMEGAEKGEIGGPPENERVATLGRSNLGRGFEGRPVVP